MPATGTPAERECPQQRQFRRHPRMHARRQRSTVDTSHVHYRLHPGDAEQEEGKLGLSWVSGDDHGNQASMSSEPTR